MDTKSVDLITTTPLKRLMGGELTQHRDAGQKDDACLGRMVQDNVNFHHTTQNKTQFKTYELFISGLLHLIFFRSRLTASN